jgi:hypothetical protein
MTVKRDSFWRKPAGVRRGKGEMIRSEYDQSTLYVCMYENRITK